MAIKSLTGMIRESAAAFGELSAQKYKEDGQWRSVTYRELVDNIDRIALHLLSAGLQRGDRVAVFSENRPEWTTSDLAAQSIGAVTVPIYATNTPSQVAYIISDSGAKAVFIDTPERFEPVKDLLLENKDIRSLVLFEGNPSLSDERIRYYSALLQTDHGSEIRDLYDPAAEWQDMDATATIIYTSGTTGDPKGVMLSNRNFFHQFMAFEKGFNIDSSDRSLCFLPLSHVYERMWSYMVFKFGATNNYLRDPKKILEYLQDVKPTVMVSVPRLYEKIYAGIMDKLDQASSFKKALFTWALSVGRKMADVRMSSGSPSAWLIFVHRLADRLVLKKLRALVGGDKKFFSAGGAPLSREIEIFFYSMGILICQGYGLTESSPMISYNGPKAFRFGSVGKPVEGCMVKISEEGEILAKGDNITTGYFRNEDATRETLRDGWLHTGDIGYIDEDGFLFITDRIKDLIITSGGKNIAPQRIESMISKDHYFEQCVAVGDRRNYITALIVPNFQALRTWAEQNGISGASDTDLASDPRVIEFYRERIARNTADLARFEQIKNFTLLDRPFTQEGGELTPSLKIKRNVVQANYKDVIDRMYV